MQKGLAPCKKREEDILLPFLYSCFPLRGTSFPWMKTGLPLSSCSPFEIVQNVAPQNDAEMRNRHWTIFGLYLDLPWGSSSPLLLLDPLHAAPRLQCEDQLFL